MSRGPNIVERPGLVLARSLVIGEHTVAYVREGRVIPLHGYHHPHPYWRRIRAWARRRQLDCYWGSYGGKISKAKS